MIRPISEDDHSELVGLAITSGLFEPDQTELIADMLASPADDDAWFTDDTGDMLAAVAYVAPEKMTRGTWNLYFIAVHPDHQRQGRGEAMLNHVINWLSGEGQRILLVETAGVDDFEYVRRFYSGNGFESEARIRDFYDRGVDKIVFRRPIT